MPIPDEPAWRPAVRPARTVGRPALLLGLALAAVACEAPRWQAEASPPDSALYVDGVRAPAATVEGPIPYYGVVDLSAVPSAGGGAPRRRAERAMLPIDEPVTAWIFPFDFFVELGGALLEEDPVRTVRLDLPERDDIPAVETIPPDIEAFEIRARRRATER